MLFDLSTKVRMVGVTCMLRKWLSLSGVITLVVSGFALLSAAETKKPASETIAKPLSEKEQRRRQKKLEKELLGPFKKWLEEDVKYIITDEERQALKRFTTDEE